MSDEKNRLNLDGDGFSREPLSEDELARQRHMRHHYERHFIDAEKFLDATGLRWIATFSKSAPVLVKVIIGAGIIGGALSWASERGLF